MKYHLLFLTVALPMTVLMSIESTPIDKTETESQPIAGGYEAPQERMSNCPDCAFSYNCCPPCECYRGYCGCYVGNTCPVGGCGSTPKGRLGDIFYY
uniref:Gsp_59 putative toxin n=1 Tax=Gemmula speciosa TaxID=439592 RepID=A0A098LXR7_GEMSP